LTVAGLYKDGLIKKPEGYPANYPFLLTFMHTNGANWDEDLGEIKELAKVMRATHAK